MRARLIKTGDEKADTERTSSVVLRVVLALFREHGDEAPDRNRPVHVLARVKSGIENELTQGAGIRSQPGDGYANVLIQGKQFFLALRKLPLGPLSN